MMARQIYSENSRAAVYGREMSDGIKQSQACFTQVGSILSFPIRISDNQQTCFDGETNNSPWANCMFDT